MKCCVATSPLNHPPTHSQALIEGLIEVHNDDPTKVYVPSALNGAIFCGHLVTDMDSIAGAIGAADLYQGTASRASEVRHGADGGGS